jgi:hypothetical protein
MEEGTYAEMVHQYNDATSTGVVGSFLKVSNFILSTVTATTTARPVTYSTENPLVS